MGGEGGWEFGDAEVGEVGEQAEEEAQGDAGRPGGQDL